jgi:hypothetical protein
VRASENFAKAEAHGEAVKKWDWLPVPAEKTLEKLVF